MPWEIKEENESSRKSRYYLLARVDDGGDVFELETRWADCVYSVIIYNGTRRDDEAVVLTMLVVEKGDPEMFSKELMKLTNKNTRNEVGMVNSKQKDAFVTLNDLECCWDN